MQALLSLLSLLSLYALIEPTTVVAKRIVSSHAQRAGAYLPAGAGAPPMSISQTASQPAHDAT